MRLGSVGWVGDNGFVGWERGFVGVGWGRGLQVVVVVDVVVLVVN